MNWRNSLIANYSQVHHNLFHAGSFFQRDLIAKQRTNGLPLHLITHEDVLIFRTKPPGSTSPIPLGSRRPHPLVRTKRATPANNPEALASVAGSWAA